MKILAPVAISILLAVLPYVGMQLADMHLVLGIVVPYAAFFIFLTGFLLRIARWIRTPVPFNITTTAGQQKSLPWIKSNPVDNPSNYFGVIVRMAAEVFIFRSLFRNTKSFLSNGRLIAQSTKWLWSFALIFHYAMLIIILRHIRFFVEIPPLPIRIVDMVDSMFQVGSTVPLPDRCGVHSCGGMSKFRGKQKKLSLHSQNCFDNNGSADSCGCSLLFLAGNEQCSKKRNVN